ncbi:hypothetical protein C7405_103218 [Paraburkholderia caballeronis]|uniref:DUF2970 domain-containing protein n=1 Tax=Paraburkholderia caballeronis TaxID=416943 RepID=UPI0010657942|nr:DUF2970 domain-containing protein [Paraburkholderia caballeronis]TDV37091.1 hypothetical protein C7405_103218 [Paraburkholderia caballeronis]
MSGEGDNETKSPGGTKQKAKGGGFLQLIGAVAWSFLGVRKRRDLEADAAQLNPLHLVIAGVLGAALFVVVLLLIVHAVVG